MLQDQLKARLVLPVLLSAEVPFIIHPAPEPKVAPTVTPEQAAAIDALFAGEGGEVAQLPAEELLKLLADPADEVKAFAEAWTALLSAPPAATEEEATEEAADGERSLSKADFMAMCAAASAEESKEQAAEEEGEEEEEAAPIAA